MLQNVTKFYRTLFFRKKKKKEEVMQSFKEQGNTCVAEADENKCNICYEPYDCMKRYPVVLPCGNSKDHRVCRECFIALEMALCPYDRAAFDVAAVQPDFTLMRSLLEPRDDDGARRVEDLERSWVAFGRTHFNKINPLERKVRSIERANGRDHMELFAILNDLGEAYNDIYCHAEARELFERTLTIAEKHWGPDQLPNHPEVAITLMNLGNAYGALGDAAKKRELLERSLIIQEAHFGPNHPNVAITLANLGNAYGALGNAIKKCEFLKRAYLIFAHVGHPFAARIQKMLQEIGVAMPPV